jgi:hypothetical protein
MDIPSSTGPPSPPVPDGPKPGTYSPVTVDMKDTLGAIFLGIVTLTLLIAFMRAEARSRGLLAQLAAA